IAMGRASEVTRRQLRNACGRPAFHSITSSARASSRGHLEAERSRRFEVDDQLVLRWRLHRQIGWLLALQDAVDVTRRAPILIDEIRPVGDQAAIADIKTGVVDDRQSVPSRKRKDQLSMI